MVNYLFEKKNPCTERMVLACRVDIKNSQEQIWIGTEYEVLRTLRGKENAQPIWAETRPVGTLWTEFGKASAEGWTEAVWGLCGALTALRSSERKAQEETAGKLLSQLATEDNAAAIFTAIQLWEIYLRCCQGRNKKQASSALREYVGLLIAPFGEYSPEMVNWKREHPVQPIWNDHSDARLEVWYPQANIPFECAVASRTLTPLLIYYRQRILDAGLILRTCTNCGKVFFANDSRSSLCGQRCKTASKKKARQTYEDKFSGLSYEQAYEREYMFWYNRVTKLKKKNSPPEQLQTAQNALKEFRTKALGYKGMVKNGKMDERKFINWMLEQEHIIEDIMEG